MSDIGTAIIAVATIVYAFFTILVWRATIEGLKQTRKLQIDIVRPWLDFTHSTYTYEKDNWTDPQAPEYNVLHFYLRNYGQTPAVFKNADANSHARWIRAIRSLGSTDDNNSGNRLPNLYPTWPKR